MADDTRTLSRRSLLTSAGALMAAGSLPLQSQEVEPWTSTNRFLGGAFVPVFDERDDADLKVAGELPPRLRGAFMRIGPNPLFKPDDHYAYPFDGTGMVHAVYLEDGRARYRNRWVRTREFVAERKAQRRLYNSTFSAPPHANLANTNIIHHAGRYLALYEGGAPYEMDRELNTLGLFDYGGRLPGAMSAHPKQDPVSGELLSIAYSLRTGGLTYLRADRTGTLDRIVPFQAPWPAMVHDIAITEQHVIAFVCPLVFDFSKPGPPATWQPDRGTRVAIVPRNAQSAGDIVWLEGPPFFQFHAMNAFTQGSRIEIIVPWYDSFSLTAPSTRLELHRLVLDTAKKTFRDETIDDRACEFPRINDRHLGRPARYGYVGLRDPRPGEATQSGAFEAIARYDLKTGQKQVRQFAPGVTVCEPVFVPDPHGKSEADGFIFTFAHHAGSPQGSFVILDARNLGNGPLAEVRLPRRVPAGLHGSWTAADGDSRVHG
jgi:carotenoid cleavage dioxygenase-like enzyme